MDITFASTSVSLIFAYLIFKTFQFLQNYNAAVRTGYPIYLTPIPSKNIFWMILSGVFQPQLQQSLPTWLYERMDVTMHGWEFRLKNQLHQRFGKTFIVVTPDEVVIWSADPDVAAQVLKKTKEFMQAPITKKIIDILGPNVLTANGEEWQRQHRIVAKNLDERISEVVWKEANRQASSMLDYLEKSSDDKTIDGLRTLAINVLGHSGYGQSPTWTPECYGAVAESDMQKRDLTYFESIYLVTVMLLEAAFLPPKLMKLPIMPASWQLLGKAMENLPTRTAELLDEERRVEKRDSEAKGNFLSMMVRLSAQEGNCAETKGLSLSESEISGNLFVFSAAGFDTTANTMGYAVTELAAHPEWQEWVREELQALDPDPSTWNYDETFRKCQRVLAIMFETLRLFTPVLHSTRSIYSPQTITDSSGSHYLQAPMMVYVSSQSIHCSPEIWGSDALAWRPSAWIDASTNQVMKPAKNTFLPWSGGPRECPGKKMAQVEFVSTFATLLRNAKCEAIRLKRKDGQEENQDMVTARLEAAMQFSVCKLTLQMRKP